MKYKIFTELQDMDNIDFIPSIIILFYIKKQKNILQASYLKLKNKFKDIDIIGCSNIQNIYHTLPHLKPSNMDNISYIAISMPKKAYSIEICDNRYKCDFLKKYSAKYKAIIFSSKYNKGIEKFIDIFNKKIGKNRLFGSISGSSDYPFNGEIFYNGNFIDKGSVVWFINSELYNLNGISLHDFYPIDFEMEITKAKKFTIYEIERRPALDMIEDIIGKIDDDSIASFDHPFFIKSKNSKAKYTPLSAMYKINRDNGSIELYKHIFNGDRLQLSIPFRREEQEKQLNDLYKHHKTDSIGFLFLCIAYTGHWSEMEHTYIMRLSKKINIPFIGLHSLGEICSIKENDDTLIQNQTITFVTLSKSEKI